MREFPLLDPRTEEALRAELKRRAASELCGDTAQGGLLHTLLALHAGMLAGTVDRLNRTPEKHRLAFLNLQQLLRRAARPSEAIAVFEVIDGYDTPVVVPKGSLVAAQTEEEPILYRTKWAFDAIPAKICDIIWSDSKTDTVQATFAREEDEQQRQFCLWESVARKEEQHLVDFLFEDIFTDADGCRAVFLTAELLLGEKPLDSAVLADPTKFLWSIHSWRGAEEIPAVYTPITAREMENGSIRLFYTGFPYRQPVACLRLELLDASLSDLIISKLYIASSNSGILPEAVLAGDHELDASNFYPFQNPMQSLDACFIFCEEALLRPGAQIITEFDLELEEALAELPEIPETVDYKWVMKRPQPKPAPEIAQAFARLVLWEYWNGAAYCALRERRGNASDFTDAASQIRLVFDCPTDIAQGSAGGRSGCFLRLSSGICEALYQLPRRVYTPRIKNLKFSYRYRSPVFPVGCIAENFRERRVLTKGKAIAPFCAPPQDQQIFIGLDTLPPGARIQLYFELDERFGETQPFLTAWMHGAHPKKLAVDDGTWGLTKSGIISVILPESPEEAQLFGKLRYWLCFKPEGRQAPRTVRGIYLNAQRIQNRVRHTEYRSFSTMGTQSNIQLAHGNIAQAWVFVRVRASDKRGDAGWEAWREYTLSDGDFSEGFYMLDYNSGTLTFPPQILARAAEYPNEDFVGITYDICDGARGNVPAYAINSMQEEVPFIGAVYNPLSVGNGEDSETDGQLAARAEHRLYHGGRAVSTHDFELIAKDLYPQIQEAKCVQGRPVHLALLLKGGRMNFAQMRAGLLLEFTRVGCTGAVGTRVEIIEAIPVPFCLQIRFVSEQHILSASLKQVEEKIEKFLNPVSGGLRGEGWRIGALPTYGQIKAYIATQMPRATLVELVVTAQGGGLCGDWSSLAPGMFHVPGKVRIELEVDA